MSNGTIIRFTYIVLFALHGFGSAQSADEDALLSDPYNELKSLADELEVKRELTIDLETQADKVSQNIIKLRDEATKLSDIIQSREAEIRVLSEDVAHLQGSYEANRQILTQYSKHISTSISGLVQLRRGPPVMLAFLPTKGTKVHLRVASLSVVLKALGDESERISDVLRRTESLQRTYGQQQTNLVEEKRTVEKERLELENLLHRKSSLQAVIRSDRIKIAEEVVRLASRSADLEGLIDVLESASARGIENKPLLTDMETGEPQSQSINDSPIALALPQKGSVPYPVSGSIIRWFGEKLENGAPSQGIFIEAGSGTYVAAPFEGRVVFSGNFRTYGQLLIIKHGGGYHSLLAGFARIYSVTGNFVMAGEPVGVMGGHETQGAVLYIEVRLDGTPINPKGWFENINRKVSG